MNFNLKFLKKKKKFRKGGSGIKPDLYWRYILCMTFALVLIFCIFGFYFFMEINKESVSLFPGVSGKETIKKERIDKVLEYFKEREKKSVEIINSPALIIDPSL
ncbi:MAG: hypothetical protein WCS86_02460 [Candidatus Paceibacterota bacterium]